MKKSNLTCIALLTIAISTFGLQAQETPEYYLKKYPDEFSVRLQDYTLTNIEIKKGKLEISRHMIQKNVYLDKRASSIGNITLEYNPPFTSVEDVDAYTLVPDFEKNDYDKEKVREIKDQEIMSDDVFYGGNRAKIFSYPSLQKGSISVLEYTENISEPKLLGSEVFQGYAKIEDQLLELRYDKEVDMDFKYFNCSEKDFTHTTEEKSGQIIQRWIPRDFGKLKDEDNMPEVLSLIPHIVFRIKSYTYKGETIPVLRNTADLYQWYQSLVQDADADGSPQLRAITDSLIAGATTDREKVIRIFNWVQDNIKYIAFEDGLGGFKPRLPSLVCEKRFGDCKDMSSITVSMLRYAGIPAYHTWIGTRRLPYTYSDVPSPITDNHMIASTILDGQIIFLDATNQDLPFPLPSSFIQGKEALIGISADSFLVKKVPVVSADQTITYDSAYVKLDKLDLKGTGTRNYRGYYADIINSNLNNNDKKEINDMLKYHVRKGNNKCNSSGYKIDRKKTGTIVDYSFEIPGYAYSDGDQIFVNLNLEKAMDNFKIKDDRQFPVEYRFAYKLLRTFVLEIPEGYTVSYIPKPASDEHPNFGYRISYKLNNNQLRYSLEIDLNTLMIENQDFETWNEMIKSLNRSYNETIILKKA